MNIFFKHKAPSSSNSYRSLGHQKEQEVADWLQQQNVQIIAQNFTCKGGEIDLIGLDAQQTLLFIEVKYRKNDRFGSTQAMVTPSKQKRLIHCAQFYLLKHPEYQEHAMRFDVISQTGDQPPAWIQNAFQLF